MSNAKRTESDPRGKREGFTNVGREAVIWDHEAEKKIIKELSEQLQGAVDLEYEFYEDGGKRILRVRGYKPKLQNYDH